MMTLNDQLLKYVVSHENRLEIVVSSKNEKMFIGTFDFYDRAVGIVLNTVINEACSGLRLTPQSEDAEERAGERIEFFVEKLIGSIEKDGSFGVPICAFISDTADFTAVPTAME